MKFKPLVPLLIGSLIVGCSNNDDEDDSGISSEQAASLTITGAVELVTAKSSSSSTGTLSSDYFNRMRGALNQAYDDAGTDYSNLDQRKHVWVPAMEPIETVNGILCFMGQMNANSEIGTGPYRVLVNETRCFEEDREGGGQVQETGGATNEGEADDFLDVIVDVTEVDGVMVVKAWVDDTASDDPQFIRIHAEVTEGPSDEKPFGEFKMVFAFAPNATSTETFGGGELSTLTDGTDVGFTMYQTFGAGEGEQYAAVLMTADGESGRATTGFSNTWEEGGQTVTFSGSYNLAVNSNYVALDLDEDNPWNPRTDQLCLNRNEFTNVAYNYALFDATTGTEVDIESGFPFRYDSNGDGEKDEWGHASYWGVWAGEGGLADGTEVTKASWGEDASDTPENYTVKSAPGRLIKRSVVPLSIANDLQGVRFISGDYTITNAVSGTVTKTDMEDWVLQFNGTDLQVVAKVSWGDNGRNETALTTAVTVSLAADTEIWMWSEQLGGSLRWISGKATVPFNKHEEINAGVLTADLSLKCYFNCPKAGISQANVDNDQVYDESQTLNSPIEYTFNVTTMTLQRGGSDVVFADGINIPESSWYHYGIHSGPMITTIPTGMTEFWQVWDPDLVTESYTWETGTMPWNSKSWLVDSSSSTVTFDKPIEFLYTHSTANDRNGSSTFDGQPVGLNYGGYGDLWGIPWEPVSGEEDRWLPAFSLNDGVLMGDQDQYVVKAIEVEQNMTMEEQAVCTNAGISTADVPEKPTDWDQTMINTDAVPEVTDDPKYVDGE